MSTNLESLGVFSVNATVGFGEDWSGAIAFTASSGSAQTLAGIGFTLTVTPTAPNSAAIWTGTTTGGQLTISGVGNNVLSWTVAAATKVAWAGDYYLGLIGADGTNTRLIFGPPPAASLVVGAGPNSLALTSLAISGSASGASSWPVALASLQSQLVAAQAQIATLQTQVATLQTQVPVALPQQAGGAVPVAAGLPYFNTDGYLVLAQAPD